MRKREEEFGKVKKLYISMMSLFELADKLFGATYVAFMRSQKLSVVQISNLLAFSRYYRQFLIIRPELFLTKSAGREQQGMDLLSGEWEF